MRFLAFLRRHRQRTTHDRRVRVLRNARGATLYSFAPDLDPALPWVLIGPDGQETSYEPTEEERAWYLARVMLDSSASS